MNPGCQARTVKKGICPDGKIRSENDIICQPCPIGKVPNLAKNECLSCPNGTVSNGFNCSPCRLEIGETFALYEKVTETTRVNGQLISECLFEVINYPKNQQKKLTNFWPSI